MEASSGASPTSFGVVVESSNVAKGNENEKNLALPHELIVEILLRLPVRSLLRFKCVCRSWFSLISDPQFAEGKLLDHQKYREEYENDKKYCEMYRESLLSFPGQTSLPREEATEDVEATVDEEEEAMNDEEVESEEESNEDEEATEDVEATVGEEEEATDDEEVESEEESNEDEEATDDEEVESNEDEEATEYEEDESTEYEEEESTDDDYI